MTRESTLADQAGALEIREEFEGIRKLCQKACIANPDDAQLWFRLGETCVRLGKTDEALSSFQKVVSLEPAQANAYLKIGDLRRVRGEFDSAEQAYECAVRYNPGLALAHYYRGNMLKIQSRTEDASDAYDQALRIVPGFPEAIWNRARILPVIYDNQEQIGVYRKRYSEGLKYLDEQTDLNSPQSRANALKGAMASTNFYLQYQGLDDLDLQQCYGNLLTRIVSANFPQWAEGRKMPPLGKNGKIRIGYSSAFLRANNGAVWLLGWLRLRNREKFEIYCYHTGTRVDDKTAEFKKLCDNFYHIPGNIEKTCARIVADDLHILVYPELGMEAASMAMAGLRLASVQCVGWGHPVTSGLPAMDYWLSSDLMEPENGQEHYTEQLVRLPNMAHYYAGMKGCQPDNEASRKTRTDFGLREDAVIYLCSQSLFKYLPQHDYLFPEIAKQVPNAQFVFLAISSVHVVRRFMQRLDRVFRDAGLQAQACCMMLNRLPQSEFMDINRVSDVFLDNPSWSGNNTTLAAIDCLLPVVTWPTEYMRGRHSYAILKMMGVEDTVASDARGYVTIAARLGKDEKWRNHLVEKIRKQRSKIYEDTECVNKLESFYVDVVESRLR